MLLTLDLDIITSDSDSQMPRSSLEDFTLAPFELPRALPRAFLSEGNNFGSVDWPPTASSLFPGDGNARRDEVPETRKNLAQNSSIWLLIVSFQDPSYPTLIVRVPSALQFGRQTSLRRWRLPLTNVELKSP